MRINPKLEQILSKMLEPKASDLFDSAVEVRVLEEYLQVNSDRAKNNSIQLLPSQQTKFDLESQSKGFNLKYLKF